LQTYFLVSTFTGFRGQSADDEGIGANRLQEHKSGAHRRIKALKKYPVNLCIPKNKQN
jgi:hypothetical protein